MLEKMASPFNSVVCHCEPPAARASCGAAPVAITGHAHMVHSGEPEGRVVVASGSCAAPPMFHEGTHAAPQPTQCPFPPRPRSHNLGLSV